MLAELELEIYEVDSVTRSKVVKSLIKSENIPQVILSLKSKKRDNQRITLYIRDNKNELVFLLSEMGVSKFDSEDIKELNRIMEYLSNRKINAELRTLLDE